MHATIRRQSRIVRTPRMLQMSGMFDVPPAADGLSSESWSVNFDLPQSWNVGVIVGPSGCGKSTLAAELWPGKLVKDWPWPDDQCILDGFAPSMSVKEIVALLSSVGFSSPPAWLRPYRVLSNGQQFRVNLARTLAEMPDLAVVDEFTSVVDRTVAKVGSAAIAKTVRRNNAKLIAVTCHYDVLDWLEPDWVYQPATGKFETRPPGARGEVQLAAWYTRPKIELEICRVAPSTWALFKPHHYLNSALHRAAKCLAMTYLTHQRTP